MDNQLTQEELAELAEQGIFVGDFVSFDTSRLDLAIKASEKLNVGQKILVKNPTNHMRSKLYVQSKLTSDFKVSTIIYKEFNTTRRQLVIKRIK